MSSERYEDRQLARDREYARAWEKLTPAQRRQLAKSGIKGPELPVYRTGKHDEEALVERVAEPTAEEPREVERGASTEVGTLAVARLIVGEILAQDNVRLTAECLGLVAGLHYDGNSMTQIAKRHGVSRAAVSKRCVEIADALGLPPARAMKRLTARWTYERRARNCHSRNAY